MGLSAATDPFNEDPGSRWPVHLESTSSVVSCGARRISVTEYQETCIMVIPLRTSLPKLITIVRVLCL